VTNSTVSTRIQQSTTRKIAVVVDHRQSCVPPSCPPVHPRPPVGACGVRPDLRVVSR